MCSLRQRINPLQWYARGGQPKYQCEACGYQARFVPAAVAKAAPYAQAGRTLLTECNSQGSNVCTMGTARMTVAKLVKKCRWLRPGSASPDEKSPAPET